jgi:hypothetical protein
MECHPHGGVPPSGELRHRTQGPRSAAENTKGTGRPRILAGMPGAGLTNSMRGQARPDRPALKPYRGKPAVRKCVQRRLARSVGNNPTEARVRRLVAWVAGRKETEFLKPTDKAIHGMVSESSGRNESKRRGDLERRKSQRPSLLPEGEGSMDRRTLTDAASHSGGARATARGQGRVEQLEKPVSSHCESSGAGNPYNRHPPGNRGTASGCRPGQ